MFSRRMVVFDKGDHHLNAPYYGLCIVVFDKEDHHLNAPYYGLCIVVFDKGDHHLNAPYYGLMSSNMARAEWLDFSCNWPALAGYVVYRHVGKWMITREVYRLYIIHIISVRSHTCCTGFEVTWHRFQCPRRLANVYSSQAPYSSSG